MTQPAIGGALFDAEPLRQIIRTRPPAARASELTLTRSTPALARRYVAAWHSRLPLTQTGPWKLAFTASLKDDVYGAALWHNPSARGLPPDWLELRRLVISEDAPPHAASWMLGAMRRWVRREMPEVPRLISYQDVEVHTGTIYKAAGWRVGYYSTPRVRDRTPNRIGTSRKYRSDLNGQAPAASGKNRWEVQP